MITKASWSIPTDASQYRPTTHASQRKKYRSNPSFEWADVATVIESAAYNDVAHKTANKFNIYGWVELENEHHKLRVTVGMLPSNIHEIVTVCCPCHDAHLEDCDPQYR